MSENIKASVCIATYNKRDILFKVLDSIFRQKEADQIEVIVVDDGSTDNTADLVDFFNINYIKLIREARYRNPALARNTAMKSANGETLILQSDDVVHSGNTLTTLLNVPEHQYYIATVWNQYSNGDWGDLYTGSGHPRPLFFLGSVLRKHVYAIGGNDESFIEPGYEDDWFACGLSHGLNLQPIWLEEVIAFHQHHDRPSNSCSTLSQELYSKKREAGFAGTGSWFASTGPWEFK